MPGIRRIRQGAEQVGEPSHTSLGVIGTVVAALCCIAVPLVLLTGGAGFAAWSGYAWVAIPLLLAGLVAYLLWRQTTLKTDRSKRNHL
jgi:mercuric ion transport protein